MCAWPQLKSKPLTSQRRHKANTHSKKIFKCKLHGNVYVLKKKKKKKENL